MTTVLCVHGGQRRQLTHRASTSTMTSAYGFAQDYNGIVPVESVQVEERQVGPAGRL